MIGHLLHVGFPKTGSKFLQRWFSEHPQLVYREGQFAGYRDVYAVEHHAVAARDGVRYHVTSSEGFTAPRRDAGREVVAYEDSVDPSIAQETVCALLASLFPNAHVLIVTRGFRSMILSSFSQYARSGGDVALEQLIAHASIEHPWNYDRVVGMYLKAFGNDKVIVLPYELLRDDVDRFLRAIEERLGLQHFLTPPDRMNASLSPVEMYWYPRLTRAVRRLPIGAYLKRMYLYGAFRNRFRPAIAMLQRVRPGKPVTSDAIPDHVIAAFGDKARTLCNDPLYAPYAQDYLVEPVARRTAGSV
jgi:hypothetical protein